MRVLVTGAAGAVGRLLLERLVREEAGVAQVIGVDRVPLVAPASPRLIRETFDLREAGLPALLQRHAPDALIHLPAVAGFAAEREPGQARRLNVESTLAVARALREADRTATEAGPPIFVFTSSVAAIGAGAGRAVADETAPCRPTSVYGEHKAEAESLLCALAAQGGLDLRILRLPTLLFRRAQRTGRPTSGFMSDLANAVARGESAVVPAAADFAVAVNATEVAVDALVRLIGLPGRTLGAHRIAHLPAWTLTPRMLLDALQRAGFAAPVRFEPDPELLRLCGSWPSAMSSRLASELDPDWKLPAGERLEALVAKAFGQAGLG